MAPTLKECREAMCERCGKGVYADLADEELVRATLMVPSAAMLLKYCEECDMLLQNEVGTPEWNAANGF
jgi:hypothetical protein